MSDKAKLIKEMLEMQKKFMAYEQEKGVSAEEYYSPQSGTEFDGFREKYQEMANKVVDMAHEDKGSHR